MAKATPLAWAESATIIVAGDFDGDGKLDLFVPHRDGGQSVIFWNDGTGRFPDKTPVGPPTSNARAAAAADLNGDGRIDIVVGDERQGTFVYLNDGQRNFDEVMLAPRRHVPYAVAIADVNRDGKPDIVVGYRNALGSVFFNDVTGTNFLETEWGDSKGAVYGIARSDAPDAFWFRHKDRRSLHRQPKAINIRIMIHRKHLPIR